MSEGVIWEGRELVKMGELMDAVLEIVKSGDVNRAAAFMEAYEKICDAAVVRSNIGYAAGYYDAATAKKIFDLFDCRHPIFGRTFPSDKWAFELGYRRGSGGRMPPKE